MSAMPGVAFWVAPRIGHVRERAVRPAQITARSPTVDRRSHNRMAESHPAADVEQTAILRRICGIGRDSELFDGPPQQERLPERFGGRDQQELPCLVGQRRELPREVLVDEARGESERPDRRNPPAHCIGVSPRG